MLEQILAQAVSHVQLITAALILSAVALELIHIGQTRRINKKLSRAGRWLQRYLNAVFSEDTHETAEKDTKQAERTSPRTRGKEQEVQLEAAQPKSLQEENMRASLARRKQKKDEELLDSVLQEIFD